jgi:maleate cis-trans isomerase
MYGWRARIGYISPSSFEMTTYEYHNVAPDGIAFVGVTCNISDWDDKEYEQGLSLVDKHADYLASRKVDFIIHGGGPLVFSAGKGFDVQLVEGLEKRTKVPTTTTILSARKAFDQLGAKRIAIASPYPQKSNDALVKYLTDYGYTVVKAANRETYFKTIYDVSNSELYRLAKGVLDEAPDAECLYMPCGNWPVGDLVEVFEQDFQTPVVINNHANFFTAFKALGIRDEIRGHGRLLASLAET